MLTIDLLACVTLKTGGFNMVINYQTFEQYENNQLSEIHVYYQKDKVEQNFEKMFCKKYDINEISHDIQSLYESELSDHINEVELSIYDDIISSLDLTKFKDDVEFHLVPAHTYTTAQFIIEVV